MKSEDVRFKFGRDLPEEDSRRITLRLSEAIRPHSTSFSAVEVVDQEIYMRVEAPWGDWGSERHADERLRSARVALVTAFKDALGAHPFEEMLRQVESFRAHVEASAHVDMFVKGRPVEHVGRALLQAWLRSRSYAEVPVAGGRVDMLAFPVGQSRIVFELKIWRGRDKHEAGMNQLKEYILHEGTKSGLAGAVYVVFDPTVHGVGAAHVKNAADALQVNGVRCKVVVIRIRPDVPSKIGS